MAYALRLTGLTAAISVCFGLHGIRCNEHSYSTCLTRFHSCPFLVHYLTSTLVAGVLFVFLSHIIVIILTRIKVFNNVLSDKTFPFPVSPLGTDLDRPFGVRLFSASDSFGVGKIWTTTSTNSGSNYFRHCRANSTRTSKYIGQESRTNPTIYR